jgi:hypothetical protein
VNSSPQAPRTAGLGAHAAAAAGTGTPAKIHGARLGRRTTRDGRPGLRPVPHRPVNAELRPFDDLCAKLLRLYAARRAAGLIL